MHQISNLTKLCWSVNRSRSFEEAEKQGPCPRLSKITRRVRSIAQEARSRGPRAGRTWSRFCNHLIGTTKLHQIADKLAATMATCLLETSLPSPPPFLPLDLLPSSLLFLIAAATCSFRSPPNIPGISLPRPWSCFLSHASVTEPRWWTFHNPPCS